MIRRTNLLLLLGTLAGCADPPEYLPGLDGGGGGVSDGGQGGLPCAVQALLQSRCTGCHGTPLAGGAPMALQTYADLRKAGLGGQSVAQRSLARMEDAARPMPPGGGLTAAEVASFRSWVTAGAPAAACGGGAVDMGPDPFNVPPRCTSMRYWQPYNDDDDDDYWPQDDDGSAEMNPGMACLDCHRRQDGPSLQVAGTVYPTAHEPDLCYGASAATVEFTDALGVVKQVALLRSGNFQIKDKNLRLPGKVRVLYQGRERRMGGAVTSGDCNSCHTQSGANGAPGRITLP